MRRTLFVVLITLVSTAFLGCGSNPTTTTSGGISKKLPSLAPAYTGTYTTDILNNPVPFAIKLTQTGKNIIGNFTSTKITGTLTGTLEGSTLLITITEPGESGTISMVGTLSNDNDSIALIEISGTDVFGLHTSGSGNCSGGTAPTSPFADSYNGVVEMDNLGVFSSYRFQTGNYPILITNLSSDGHGSYSGAFFSQFATGILCLASTANTDPITLQPLLYKSDLTYSLNDGIDIPTVSTVHGYSLATMPLLLSTSLPNPYRLIVVAQVPSPHKVDLHPGNPSNDLVGGWTYSGDSPISNLISLSVKILPSGSNSFTAQVNARLKVNGVTDTIYGTLRGGYDVAPHDGYAMHFTVPPNGIPLTISNNSGQTKQLDLYLVWVDNQTLTMQMGIDTTGNGPSRITMLKDRSF